MTETHQCCKRLYGGGRTYRGSPCSKAAKVERDGKWYCAIHDPVKVAAKGVEKRARWEKEWAEGAARNRLHAAAPALLAALLSVRALISEAAMTGFNCHDGDWAERLFASQGVTTDAINQTKPERERPQPIQPPPV